MNLDPISTTVATTSRSGPPLEFRFVTGEQEREFHKVADVVYRGELGVTVDDDGDDRYAGGHRTLVCRTGGDLVGGFKMYFAGEGMAGKLPMEHDGVPAAPHHLTHFPDERLRCEVCRVVVLREFRKLDVHSAFMRILDRQLRADDCHLAYWLAGRSQTVNSHRALRALGYGPSIVRPVSVRRGAPGRIRQLTWSCVQLPRRRS